jgi:hypothetical protein
VTVAAGPGPGPVPWGRIFTLTGFIVLFVLAVVLVLVGAVRLTQPIDVTTAPGLPLRGDGHEIVVTGRLAEGSPRPVVTEHCRTAAGIDMPADELLDDVLVLTIDGVVFCRGERGRATLDGMRVTVLEIDVDRGPGGGDLHRIEAGPVPRLPELVAANIPGIAIGVLVTVLGDLFLRSLHS